MISFTHHQTQTFNVVSCYTCGVPFGITAELYKRVVTDAKGSVYCPACGSQTIWKESEDSKRIRQLQQKLEWEAAEVARQKTRREVAEASLQATKGVVTRMKRRQATGTCPCCKRSFCQLERHMQTKHPEFVKEQQIKAP